MLRVHSGSHDDGSRDWDAGCGDDCEGVACVFVQGKPIKAICRELNLSRKVVRKVIRSEATEFRYARESQPLPKIGPWKDELDRLLSANESKAAREQLTLIRIFEELRDRGYAGCHRHWIGPLHRRSKGSPLMERQADHGGTRARSGAPWASRSGARGRRRGLPVGGRVRLGF